MVLQRGWFVSQSNSREDSFKLSSGLFQPIFLADCQRVVGITLRHVTAEIYEFRPPECSDGDRIDTLITELSWTLARLSPEGPRSVATVAYDVVKVPAANTAS